jgi:hypothetical protein
MSQKTEQSIRRSSQLADDRRAEGCALTLDGSFARATTDLVSLGPNEAGMTVEINARHFGHASRVVDLLQHG